MRHQLPEGDRLRRMSGHRDRKRQDVVDVGVEVNAAALAQVHARHAGKQFRHRSEQKSGVQVHFNAVFDVGKAVAFDEHNACIFYNHGRDSGEVFKVHFSRNQGIQRRIGIRVAFVLCVCHGSGCKEECSTHPSPKENSNTFHGVKTRLICVVCPLRSSKESPMLGRNRARCSQIRFSSIRCSTEANG